MARKIQGSRSTRLVAQRALAMLARLLKGEATRQELIQTVVDEIGEDAYGERPVDSFHRDLKFLRHLGFEIKHRRSLGTYYLVDQGHPILRLYLSGAELGALAAMRNAFRGLPYADRVEALIAKIEERLPAESRQALQREPLLSFSFGPADDLDPRQPAIRRLEKAVEEHRLLMFDYRSPAREGAKRHIVEPYNLDFREGHLYFKGYDVEAGRSFEFRVDRIQSGSARLLPPKFVPRKKLGRTYTIRYRLAPQIARYGASERFLNQREERQDDGSVLVTAETDSLFWAAKKLLKYGEKCQVLEPPELVAEMKRVVREMARIYEIGEGGE